MLPEEAQWLGDNIALFDPQAIFPMCNIGSSSRKFVTQNQPWIDNDIFRPLRLLGRKVVNIDIKQVIGVDIVGDIMQPEFLDKISKMRFHSILCSNLLEHVHNRKEFASILTQCIPVGGYIFVSCPYRYPFHADPIDTMFRPAIEEIAALFPGTQVHKAAIVRSGTYGHAITSSTGRLFLTLFRLALPFYKPTSWYSGIVHMGWLFRHFQATCVILRKVHNA